MFQFPGFASKTLCVQVSDTWSALLLSASIRGAAASGIEPARSVTLRSNNNKASGGFPHSEIHGSKPIPGSPWLIAGYHVLHRLLLPRHPPNALIALDSIRKKTDPERPGRSRLESKFTLPRPRHHGRNRKRGNVKISVLDLDNAAVDRHPQGWPPPHPHSGAAGNAFLSLNDVKPPRGETGVRLDDGRHPGRCGRQSNRKGDRMVEPGGFEPPTLCLQSRCSTS